MVAHNGQNGIGLVDATDTYVSDNDLSGNTGWAIHLFRSSHNTILRNDASRTRRCVAPIADCGAAAILVREGSDSNTISENDVTLSSIGVLLTGLAPLTRPSIGNLVYRNDASLAPGGGFAARGTWRVTLLDNRADSAAVGHPAREGERLARAREHADRRRRAAIDISHGGDTGLEANALLGAPVGIRVATPDSGVAPSRAFRIDDNMIAGVDRGHRAQGRRRQPDPGERLRRGGGWAWW